MRLTARSRGAEGGDPWVGRGIALLAVGFLAIGLSGCLSSGYAYVNHRNSDNTELYFKLPSSWKLFGASQVIEAANGKLSRSQLSSIEAGQWVVYFAATHHIGIKQVGTIGSHVPEGEAFAHQLSSTERDGLSFSTIRSEILGADPLQAGSGPFNVLGYHEFVWPGGIRGSRLTVDITQTSGVVTTFEQVVVVDPQTNWIFGIGLGCRASCWGPASGQIKQVLDSWTVRELAR